MTDSELEELQLPFFPVVARKCDRRCCDRNYWRSDELLKEISCRGVDKIWDRWRRDFLFSVNLHQVEFFKTRLPSCFS